MEFLQLGKRPCGQRMGKRKSIWNGLRFAGNYEKLPFLVLVFSEGQLMILFESFVILCCRQKRMKKNVMGSSWNFWRPSNDTTMSSSTDLIIIFLLLNNFSLL